MKFCYITFRSITPAQRGEAMLRRSGVECSIQRTPRWMEQQGCGYCLRLHCAEVPAAVQILDENTIPYRKLYRDLQNGKLEEMVL